MRTVGYWRTQRGDQRGCGGFSMLEVLMVLVMMAIVAMIATPSMSGMLRGMRLRSATDNVKNQLLAARFRAVANPEVHCGVYFDIANGRSVIFFDNGGSSKYSFSASDDELHGAYRQLPSGIVFSLPSSNAITNEVVVFRGDGSAKNGGSIEIKDSDDN
ncbi:MAG: prepilin-type N-terminal cleavage/methylation domain-containing protein, partial [Chitinivibrionales bacterium]|nr:prepilin-type N-terminal cleavage/methylation domain-containing protein [Chitinivibrionales bacterium]